MSGADPWIGSNSPGRGLADAGRRQQADRAADHRQLVRQDVAEHVLGDDHVEPARVGDQGHGRRIDIEMVERDIGIEPATCSTRVAPQPRRRQHVGLVDRGDLLAALARRREGDMGDPLDLVPGIDAQVGRIIVAIVLLAEIGAAGELAHHQYVGAGADMLLQRRKMLEAAQHARRPQVREQAEPGAELEQAGFGPLLALVPLRPADRAGQDRVRALAGVERLGGQRHAVPVDGDAAEIPSPRR